MTRTVSISFWTKILALAALVLVPYLAMTGGTAHAAIGDQLFWSGGDVRITVQPASAGYTSQLRLYNLPTGGSHYIALNNQFGTVVTLSQSFLTSKGYTVGQELIFGIYVTNTGNTFRMGPGSRNGDGISHANVVTLAPSGSYTHRFNVGFEDLYGGGDKDYDDNVFRFEGAVAITPVVPPTADAGGPYTVAEGDSVGLAGTGNDPDNSGVLSFAWDLDNNGSFETAGQNPTFSAAGLDGPSSSIVGLKVTDGDGASGTDTATVNITNVAPNLPSISVTSPVDEGSSATLTGTFTDPGTPDVHTLNIDWGDGSSGPVVLPVGNRTFSIGHQYIDDDPTATPSDDYTVAVSLSDDDGGVATQPSGVFWDFQNATSVGGISTSVGSPITPGVSGVASQTGGGPAENWGGDIVHLTRFIGPSNYPYFDVTVSGPTSLDGLTFSHVHNHNPGFPTAGGYQVQLQIDSGSGYSNIGSPFAVLPGDSGPDTISLNGTVVGTGTHRIRFLASGFAYGNNSNTEFFVLNNVTLNATAPGSYSATVTVNNVAPNLESGVVNLNSWTAENISSGSGSWNVSGDANSVLQTVNGNPTFFYSDFNALGSPLSGSIQVQTTGDDDFIGFAIGFEPGDASNAAADYLLVDWKQGNQSAFGGFAGRGLAVSRVTGIANNTNFWAHNGPVTELARATTLGSTGWGDYQVNQFQFDFSSTQLRVFVNGVLEIDVSPASGTFSDGRFAFYNFSQSQVRYSAIQADGISGLEASSVSLSKNFTDVGTADTHSATINWGDGTGNLPGTVTQGAGSGTVSGNHVYADNGEYTVTVTATDDDGGTDSDTLTATIANVPPTADAGGPYSGPEGSSISLNGSGTDVAGIADPLSYSWDLDNNGSFETPGQNVAFPAVDGPSTHTVSLRVDDGDGGVTIDSTTVTVNNVAPTVTADNASVTINEADTAANTGTFGDVGVDDVTITSSIGDITQAAGTWSWSFDSSDGPDESQTVTITATDSDGAPSSTTFDLTVNNVAPLAIAIGDVIDEDGTATVTGTISDPGTLDSFTVVVNWGGSEGSTTVALPAGSTSFIATHQYLDDNPTGTLSDVYPVSVTVTDDDGGASTANTSVTVNNVAPVLGTGKIVVNNDEWTFSNAGFAANSVSATQFVVNVADYFTGGTPGSFLAYSSNFGLTESSLSTAMANAGHTWTVSTVVPFTVSSLLTYDAVFLAGNYVDQQVLIDYVNAGGNVYIGAGTGWGGAATEAASWNTFLNEFGLNLASVYNGINGSPSPSSSHPLLAGVSTMFFGNGNSVNVTSPSTANAQILFTEQGQGMLGVAAIGSVSANSILENGTATLEASFFDLGTLDQHTVTINWGDGTSADVLTLPVGDRSFTATHQYLDDNPTGTPADNYTISITVSDDDGGSDSESTAIQVTNVAPVITASGGVIDENGIATVTIGVTDPGSLDTFTGVIDWGEGSPEGITASHGVNTYTHQYLDDDPTGTASDIYAVSVTVTDDDTGVGTAGTTVTVNNVAPAVSATGDAINEGQSATVDASFSDIGSLDTHTATVDWGDGNGPISIGAVTSPISESHVYGDNGTYTVVVTVTDDDGGVGQAFADVTVSNLDPTAVLDTTSAITFPSGLVAFTGTSGEPQSHSASSADPGSDDLTFTWNFGPSTIYFNDGVGPDPTQSSDGTFPFATSDTAVITPALGVIAIEVTVTDDDGGSASDSLAKIVTDTCDCTKSQGFWKHQFDDKEKKNEIATSTLETYLSIVTAVSSIFDEQVALSGIVDANSIFNPNKTGNENNNTSNGDPSRNASLTGSGKKKGDGDDEDVADDGDDESAAGEDTDVSESREKALSQILAAWLNFAKGSVDWTEMIDTTGDGTPDTEFGVLIAEVETIMNNPGATKADLERAKDLAEAVNQHDKGNPDCDTVTGGGDESKADTKADDDASGAGDDDEKKDDEGGKSKKSEKKGKK